jgi:hypothetical protein
MSSTVEDHNSVASSSSDQTCSTSSTAAVATPSRKYRVNQDIQSDGVVVETSTSATTMSPSGASVATSVLSAGGSLLDQRKLRKRVALMKLEQNKNLTGNYPSVSKPFTGRSFDQAQEDKEILMQAKRAVAATSSGTGHLVNLNSCFHLDGDGMKGDFEESIATDSVSELRRRRLYEMHHNRPYSSQTKPKKKFKFWQQEKHSSSPFGTNTSNNFSSVFTPSAPKIATEPRRVSSFSDYQDLSTPEARRHYREVTFQDDNNALMDHSFRLRTNSSFDLDSSWIHPSSGSKLYMTVNDLQDEDEEPSDIPLYTSPRRALWNEQASALQTQMQNLVLRTKVDEDKDEIMDGLVYDSDEIMTPVKERTYVTLPSTTVKVDKKTEAIMDKSALVSPDASSLISPLNAVMSFETPEKVPVPIVTTASVMEDFAACHGPSSFEVADEHVLSPPNAPKKERNHKTPTERDCKEVEYTTPVTVDTATTGSPNTDLIPMDEGDEVMGIRPMTAVKLSVSPGTGAIQWQSLRRAGNGKFSVSKGVNSARIASMREVATVIQTLANQKPGSDGATSNNSMLKLFVDLYQQSTYDEIVQHIPEIKDQGTLVICRGFDFSASTYNSVAEIKSLFEALKNVEKLDSIMLLNFRPESMIDLARILNHHPFMFRLQLHLAEGTLNGELLGVMATAPRLTHVQLDIKESCAIGTLMNSKSIQTLRVTSKTTDLAKSHMRTLIYGLGSNQTLTTLDLVPQMSIEHFRSLCSALKENRRLECLRVSLKLTTSEDSQVAAIELANLLKVNRSLVTVWNHLHEESLEPNHVGKRVLQEAFRKNSVIKEIRLHQEDPDESFLSMEKHEEHVLGIQPRPQRQQRQRKRQVVFNEDDEPSNVGDTFSEGDSFSRDGDWLIDTKFCDEMLNAIPSACSDCMIPDIGDVFRHFTGASNKPKKSGGSSVSVL